MHPTTHATLQELDSLDWFHSVGEPDEGAAQVLGSWPEAIKLATSLDWENLRLEAANQYRERLAGVSQRHLNRWNKLVIGVKPTVVKLVERKTFDIASRNPHSKEFVTVVRWDILHLAMECEYAEIMPPGMYTGLSYWYANGHFPCGWEGPFPGGKMIVY